MWIPQNILMKYFNRITNDKARNQLKWCCRKNGTDRKLEQGSTYNQIVYLDGQKQVKRRRIISNGTLLAYHAKIEKVFRDVRQLKRQNPLIAEFNDIRPISPI